MGYYLSRDLLERGDEVTLVEKDPARADWLEGQLGSIVMRGDGDEMGFLSTTGVERADAVLAVTGDDEDNLVALQLAKKHFNVPLTIARVNNPANVEAHFRTTGPEILAQLGNRVPDAFVHGVGTGGTITGVGRVLRERRADVQIVAVEPEKSAVLSGGPPGEHRIDGIGAGFVPEILDRSVLSEVRTISEADAQRTKLALARREGLLVGISAGASVKIALDIARELGPGKTVVTILCDTGERYFSSDAYFE